MNLLLTGANGFIGNYFFNKYINKYNILKFSFSKDNVNDLDLQSVYTIVHLSALVHQMNGASLKEYEDINVKQTMTLAKKAKEEGVKQFVFMSTVKVYGEETQEAYNETTICSPKDDYGLSKLKAELELKKLESSDFKVAIIRTPIVYGYGVKANIKNLINLIKKVPILPFKGIKNKRSMVYVGNLCHLLDEAISQKKGGVFLANDDHAISTTQLIELISQQLHKKVYLIKIPFFETALKLIKPAFHKRLYESLEINNTITKKELNLENPYSVEEGLKYTIQGE